MNRFEAVPVTQGPKHHFFGYYDKFQVDATGRRLLVLETDFMDRAPRPDDTARIGVVHLDDGNRLEIVAETQAWCWQQSCMLQWFPGAPDRKIVFNIRRGDRFGCCILDLESGERREYDTPVYTFASDGAFALCPNFARLATCRPGYGYEGVADPWADAAAPADDGIYRLDFATGERTLLISLAQIHALQPDAEERRSKHWFNHLLVSPDDRRFIFLCRWKATKPLSLPGVVWATRMFTADVDGSRVHLLNDNDMTSHFIWRDPQTVLAWANHPSGGMAYYYFTDRSDRVEPVDPQLLLTDGHMSYPPRGRWFVSDTYPQARPEGPCRTLFLFDEREKRRVDLGHFLSPPPEDGSIRCDLHPRWSRDGKWITFDSIHEGSRQVYRMDVESVVD